jgi:regulator of sigma E protease
MAGLIAPLVLAATQHHAAVGSFGPVLLRWVAIALAFGVIVFVHELGHFLTARATGMAVHEFSIGFGRPLLFWFRRGDTQYSFRFWPFLSYVRIAGMEPEEDHPQGYDKKPRWAQAIVLVTGCLMNFALAVGIFIVIGLAFGRPVAVSVVDRVEPDSPAAQVGLRPGDRLVGANGRTLTLAHLREAIQASPAKRLVLEVERDGARLSLPVTPERGTVYDIHGITLVPRPIGLIGIYFATRVQRMGVTESITSGFLDTYDTLRIQIAGLVGMFRRQVPADLIGPVGIVQQLYTQAQENWLHFLNLAALLTVAVGFLNLMPIPPLDGSRLVIVAYEAIRRKPVDKQKERIVHAVGMALLLLFVLLITYKDIVRIVVSRGG